MTQLVCGYPSFVERLADHCGEATNACKIFDVSDL
jgi:hypothetical protein